MMLGAKRLFAVALIVAVSALPALAVAKPSPAEALKLLPVQADVDFDRPTGAEIERAVVDVESVGGLAGWVVKTDSGQTLRRFLDTNGDNSVDQWCYFKDGIEVYRDIDVNFNKKADQYRWLGTAGTRWAVDEDENGQIDSWKTISAEEVTAEIVAALRDRDAARFRRLLLTEEDLKTLGLGEQQAKDLKTKLAAAASSFAEVAGRQRLVTAKSEWIHFGASRPGIVPAGNQGSTKDLVVYDNVTAVIETDGKHGQIVIGTLVKLGETWRLFDLPKNLAGEQIASASVGYFFQASLANRPEAAGPMPPAGAVGPEVQRLVQDLEKIDKSLATSTSTREQARLNGERADVLEGLVKAAATPEDRMLWIRQYAETISAAVQSGAFPDGVKRLEALLAQVAKMPDSADLIAYIKFRHMTAAYNLSLQEKDSDFEKINTKWLADLEQFVKDHSNSPDTAEAILQLAIGNEFSGKEEAAITWFGRIAHDFPMSDLAGKAAGAKRRLESVGKPMTLRAKTIDGKQFDIAAAKGNNGKNGNNGKIVLVHYWATWCEPCKQDMETIRALQAKYSAQGFLPVGVNVDNEARDVMAFLRTKTLPWPQVYEAGGLDGRLATEMGILTLPTMILVGRDGNVINRNIHAGELDAELKKHLR